MKPHLLVWILCLGVSLLTGCGNDRGARPEYRGEGLGRDWTPDKDGKFVLYLVENTSEIDVQLVCHSKKTGTYKMTVEPGASRFMVLKEDDYEAELRGRDKESKQGVFDSREEKILGVRRVHYKAAPRPSIYKAGEK